MKKIISLLSEISRKLVFTLSFLSFIFISIIAKGQATDSSGINKKIRRYIPYQNTVPLSNELMLAYEKQIIDSNINFHTAIKPFLNSEIERSNIPLSHSPRKPFLPFPLTRTVSLSINPVVATEAGYSNSKYNDLLVGGVTIDGNYNKNLSSSITLLAGSTVLPNYVDSFVKRNHVIPGYGYAYKTSNAYTFQSFTGYISYSPNKIFNFQIGKDKNFWGDGYRSLFLSDFSNNYPFIKLTANVWKIKYTSLFTWQQDLTQGSLLSQARNKFGTFHMLSWNATKRFNINLFEAIIWQGTDSTRARGFDVNYLNPVIFYRPIEYSLGSPDNALIGGGFKEKLFKKQELYGQVIIDEFILKDIVAQNGWWGNKQGVQLGYKIFDLFHINNLYLQTEFNYVRPYTYSHGSPQQNYGNFNEPLADPLGANFIEAIGIINYKYKRWNFQEKIIVATYGLDTSAVSYGKNIFISYDNRASEYGNKITQGLKTNLYYEQFTASYMLSQYDTRIEAGILLRNEANANWTLKTNMFTIGIKTGLYKTYRDF